MYLRPNRVSKVKDIPKVTEWKMIKEFLSI